MLVGQLRGYASSWSAVEKTNLDQKWFVDFFDGVGLFGKRGGEGVHADWAALIFLDDGEQQTAIHFVETVAIHFEHLQSCLGRWEVDFSFTTNLGVVANSS